MPQLLDLSVYEWRSVPSEYSRMYTYRTVESSASTIVNRCVPLPALLWLGRAREYTVYTVRPCVGVTP